MKKILCIFLCLIMAAGATVLPVSAAVNSSVESLIDSAELIPMMTGYTPLDQIVADFFATNVPEDADTFDKLKIAYDFLIYGSSYGSSPVTAALERDIARECNYYSAWDADYVAGGYGFITKKVGSCNHFADAFMVMARAIGLECYVMHGTITWYAGTNSHYWNLIRLGDGYYVFDPEAEWRNYDNNGSISYSNFCTPEAQNVSRSCDREKCISEFGNFQCRNKVNNPGTVIPGRVTTVTNVYETGTYQLNDNMNFRADHSIVSGIFSIIPKGVSVTVTEVYGIWGKISYNGTTGWISLDYSTKQSERPVLTTEPVVPAETSGYQIGEYVTNEVMNFRADHSKSSTAFGLIPKGTKLTITEINDVWGKLTYLGKTGWISLEYSTFIPIEATQPPVESRPLLPGDADGNGKIDAEDARLILRHAVAIEMINEAFLTQSDINGDGRITPEDARLALRKAVNLPL